MRRLFKGASTVAVVIGLMGLFGMSACASKPMDREGFVFKCLFQSNEQCFPDNKVSVCNQYADTVMAQEFTSAEECRRFCFDEMQRVRIEGPNIRECGRFFDNAAKACTRYCNSNYP